MASERRGDAIHKYLTQVARFAADSHNTLGDMLSAPGHLGAAPTAYRATHEILARLAAVDPGLRIKV